MPYNASITAYLESHKSKPVVTYNDLDGGSFEFTCQGGVWVRICTEVPADLTKMMSQAMMTWAERKRDDVERIIGKRTSKSTDRKTATEIASEGSSEAVSDDPKAQVS